MPSNRPTKGWLSALRSVSQNRKSRRRHRVRHGAVEQLEERTLLAGISIQLMDLGLSSSVGTPHTLSAVSDESSGHSAATYEWTLLKDNQPYPFTNTDDQLEFVPYEHGVYLATVDHIVNDQVSESANTTIQIPLITPDGTARVLLDAVRFQGNESLSAQKQTIYLGDDFIPVDTNEYYQLSGSARSGDGLGGGYSATNSQYFGFASYDADQKLIQPLHVSKIGPAVDTWLMKPLNPGDEYVYLNDITGWYDGSGAAWSRSLALFDYTDGTGVTHADYTYTRNVSVGAWDPGGIDRTLNRIRLSNVWAGESVSAGTAARNATSGNTFNYVALEDHRVPDSWSNYAAIFGGNIGFGKSDFRPGTSYIKPVVLANYLDGSSNEIHWSNLTVTPARASETFGNDQSIQPSAERALHLGDHLIRVSPDDRLRLSGWARSGDETGDLFEAANRQYFGFASYDSDQLPIAPLHVSKIQPAVDTRLARPLSPGDRYLYLEDVDGWYDESGASHARSFAWFGYMNSSGQVYKDYTYTRNVLQGAWNPGAIDHELNRIELATPWQGSLVLAGTAARNATSGHSFNYSALNFQSVPDEWTQYSADIGGTVGGRPTDFRPGTAFIKPVVLANYQSTTGNVIEWTNLSVVRQPTPQTFSDSAMLTTNNQSIQYADEFTPINLNEQYELTGWAQSGSGGGSYAAENRQYFGFASFDADRFQISAYHVSKIAPAVDTRLARPLNPGDTHVYLDDVSGWYNLAAPSYARSLALFGYTDGRGHTYEDYTYTRNVTLGAWEAGAIDAEQNRIELRAPWSGPTIAQGTAARNATSGSSFKYVIANHSVPTDSQRYSTIIGKQAQPEHRFSPGTAYIKPVILTNYHSGGINDITWKEITVRPLGQQGTALPGTIDLYYPNLSSTPDSATYEWTQIAGMPVNIVDHNSSVAHFDVPDILTLQTLTFRVDVQQGATTETQTVVVTVRPPTSDTMRVEGLWTDSRLEQLPTSRLGPFVRTTSGELLTIDEHASYISHDEGQTWSDPRPLFPNQTGIQVSQERVLLSTTEGVVVAAFTNLAERQWTWDDELGDAPGATLPTYVMRSLDGGQTWQDIQKLHDDWSGAVRDIIETQDGRIVFTAMKLQHDPGRHTVLTYSSDDNGLTWTASNLIDLGGAGHHGGVSEATVTERTDGSLWLLIRTNRGEFWSAESIDGGTTWQNVGPSGIPSASSPGLLKRLQSGRLVLIWNRPLPEGKAEWPLVGGDNLWSATPVSNHREELSIAFSDDEGSTWSKPIVIAHRHDTAGEESARHLAYPNLFEPRPGHLWLTTMQGGLRVELKESDFGAETATVVAFGDSTTATRGNLNIYANRLETDFEARNIDAHVVNAGVPGNHTQDARLRFEQDVLAYRPDVSIIQFGINDAAIDVWKTPPATTPRVDLKQYEENLEHFVTVLKAQGSQIILMTPNPLRWVPQMLELYGQAPYQPLDEDGLNVILTDYAETLRNVAQRHNVPLVDVYQAFEDYGDQAGQSVNDLLLDGLHPNDAGHQLIGQLLNAELQDLLK